MLTKPLSAALLCLVLFAHPAMAQSGMAPITWTNYVDDSFGFSVDLPLGLFEPNDEAGGQGMTLAEVGGSGQLSIYGGAAQGLTLDQFAERLSAGPQVRSITYKAGGNSWFVLSGDYAPDAAESTPLIFYTKVLLSPDGNRFSAFEISYPKAEKARYDTVIERLESSMTRPRPWSLPITPPEQPSAVPPAN